MKRLIKVAFTIPLLGVAPAKLCGDGYDILDSWCNLYLGGAPCHAWTDEGDPLYDSWT